MQFRLQYIHSFRSIYQIISAYLLFICRQFVYGKSLSLYRSTQNVFCLDYQVVWTEMVAHTFCLKTYLEPKNNTFCWAVVVEQLAEWSLLTPEDPGSNQLSPIFIKTFMNLKVLKRRKQKSKRGSECPIIFLLIFTLSIIIIIHSMISCFKCISCFRSISSHPPN